MNTSTRRLDTYQQLCTKAGLFFLFLTCLFIPFSTSLMGAGAMAATLFWLLSGKAFSLPRLMTGNLPVFLAIALLLLLAAAVSYSPAPLEESLSVLKKYRELLYLAVTVSLVADSKEGAMYARYGFVAGCIVLLLASYSMYFNLIPSNKFGFSTVYHITHSFFMAVLAFWSLQLVFERNRLSPIWLLVFIATSVNLFYIAPGRTGMLVYVTLLLLTILQRLSFIKILLAICLTAIAVTATYYSSANFSSRLLEAVKEVQEYQAESSRSRSSLGMRFDWWQNSRHLIGEKPLFGHGTGSFRTVQGQLITGSETQATDNPHNEYLFLAVQTGLLGAGFFVALLLSLVLQSTRLHPPERYLLQGVVVAMAVGCLMNSFLFDSHQGHFFAIIAGLLCLPNRAAPTLQI